MTGISSQPVWGIAAGLIAIALLVLILPFKFKVVEHNLEVFFLIMGVAAVTTSGRWSLELIMSALKAPVMVGGLPVGIFQIVLVFGILLFFFRSQFSHAITLAVNKLSIRSFVLILVILLGLLSSVISVILTSVILAEIVACLPLRRPDQIKLVVLTCYAVGLGAVLTPLGEPLSTILVSKLSGPPFHAGFTFPLTVFAKYIIPGVVATGIFSAMWIGRKTSAIETVSEETEHQETLKDVVVRAARVFAFIAALVLLGEGLQPLIIWFFMRVPAAALYWANMVSAVLDNATLTAVEVSSNMTLPQIISIVTGLLIAGGMLIPGNIPNIVAAGKLKISMKEWAVIGVPIGLVMMSVYFVILIPVLFR